MKGRAFLFIGIFIIIILIVGYFAVIYGRNLDFTKPSDLGTIVKLYFGWFATLFHNMKVITGNAIHMDWRSVDVNATDKVVGGVENKISNLGPTDSQTTQTTSSGKTFSSSSSKVEVKPMKG